MGKSTVNMCVLTLHFMRMIFTLQHLVRVRCFNVEYFLTLRVSDLLSLVPPFDYRIVTGST